ncbi:hypothetical protein D7C04_24270, partial [Salmonella enterica]|nr:hypothetical protein [Salmonella enterica]
MLKKKAVALAILNSIAAQSLAADVSPEWDIYGESYYRGDSDSVITGISDSLNVITGYTTNDKAKKNFIAWK